MDMHTTAQILQQLRLSSIVFQRTNRFACRPKSTHIRFITRAQSTNISSPAPSFIPRPPKVTDGAWDAADAAAIQQALSDAAKIARQTQKYGAGEVLLARSFEDLQTLAEADGQPKFRAQQLATAVLLHGARSVDDITTIPKAWRQSLTQKGVSVGRSVLHHQVAAADGTRKFLLQLHDGYIVETVGIPSTPVNASNSNRTNTRNDEFAYNNNNTNTNNRRTATSTTKFQFDRNSGGGNSRNGSRSSSSSASAKKERLTVCVSSQVGCPMRCTFCATGKGGFARNLLPHEIVDQVLTVQEQFGGTRVSNVVFMGMGEPLLNLPSVMRAHEVLHQGLGIGARHITISTVGVPNAIQAFARYDTQSTLAVSIHAPNQALRELLVPSAKAYPLPALLQDCAEYFEVTGRRVTFEYVLLSGVNDGPEHAQELAGVLKRYGSMRSHVNVIPWNPVDESEFKRPTRNGVMQFVNVLEGAGIAASVRHTRGLEAAAACGQLRNRFQSQPLVGVEEVNLSE